MLRLRNIIAGLIILGFLGLASLIIVFLVMSANLPRLITIEDYNPLLVSEVYSRDGEKVGEFFNEKRVVIPFQEMPKQLINAFISAEDSSFFEHGGINPIAIFRAFLANLRAGHTVQGGSTITQQVAKSLMLTPEKNITRKIKEAILAYRMEKNLSKEEILYLYLNQIYLGHAAHGVQAAADNYFRKKVGELTIAECAMLAGLPQAPSRYSPLLNPTRAKERQLYVLRRMEEEGFITSEEAKAAANEPIKAYYREAFEDVAPYYKETIRQFLTELLGTQKLLNEGIKIYTGMDLKKQLAAQEAIEKNLRDLDKRQGFRGAKQNLKTAEEIAQFLLKTRDELIQQSSPFRIIYPQGQETPKQPLDLTKYAANDKLPEYLSVGKIVDAIVTKIDSDWGLVTVRLAESQGIIDADTMTWARKPDPNKHHTEELLKDPAQALKVGDVIEVQIKGEKAKIPSRIERQLKAIAKKPHKTLKKENLPKFEEYLEVTLEQEPIVQGALLSFDLVTQDVLAMVGGADYGKSEYNRTIQAARQTGSSFKSIIYAAALLKGFNAASTIVDAPIVYEEGEGQETKKWKPGNFENKFSGDVLFRTAIIKSLNIPTVKIIQDIGVDWVARFARRLGIFSPLNLDYTIGLGSSGTTMYEMLKAFSAYARAGKRIHPILIRKVTDRTGEKVLLENVSLDEKFKDELQKLDEEFKLLAESKKQEAPQAAPPEGGDTKPRPEAVDEVFFSGDPENLISPQTAYLITHLLKGVVNEGSGQRARALGKPTAGKTGTTNGYYDAWFSGYTPYVATNVWVGFDNEKSIGKLETGASAALPIWLDYMKVATEQDSATDFPVPSGIVFANIDAETGKLASAKSKKVVKEAFREGTEPSESQGETAPAEEKSFLKEDLSN